MTEYYFNMHKHPELDCYAESDLYGGAIQIYLPEFKNIHSSLSAWGTINDDIAWAVMKAVLIHEDLHIAISDCVDTNGGQEHDSVYEWIKEWMDVDIDLYEF